MTVKQNKKLLGIVAILVVICLVISGFYIYTEFYMEEAKTIEVPQKVIDNRISPDAPQLVSLEIHRIRKKGIIDVMLYSGSEAYRQLITKIRNSPIKNSDTIYRVLEGTRPGIGWNKKPFFGYVAVIDGGSEWVGRETWKTWDTGFINHEIIRRIEQDQQKTTIKFTMLDKEQKLFNRVTEKKSDSFSLVYDFRYGNWTGDDYFNDSDGYGHYNGSNYEVWFSLHQTNPDGDDIPYWTEVNILGTDPKVDDSKLDPDNDGIPTTWEWKWGYDPFKWDNHTYLDPDKDGLQNIEEYEMEKWLANPYHQEIYLETDYVAREPFKPFEIQVKRGKISPIVRPRLVRNTYVDLWDHVFWEESQQMFMDYFNKHSYITVFIDDGCMGGGGEMLPFSETGTQEGGIVSQYYRNNFSDSRKGIFRYVICGHAGGWCHPQDSKNWYDVCCLPTFRDFYKAHLCYAVGERSRRIARFISALHEVGHSLGLGGNEFPGVDDRTGIYLDYVSCMNYNYFGYAGIFYSDGSHGPAGQDRNDWEALDLTYFQRSAPGVEGIGWRDFI